MADEHMEPRDTPLIPGRPPGAERAPAVPLPAVPPSGERIAAVPSPPLAARPEPAKKPTQAPPEPKDSARELVETIVFVVVLVLLLKTFLAEAFVIPTGSMADTLLGYHREYTCEQCGYHYLRNASKEAEEHGRPQGGYCPNCGFFNPVSEEKP